MIWYATYTLPIRFLLQLNKVGEQWRKLWKAGFNLKNHAEAFVMKMTDRSKNNQNGYVSDDSCSILSFLFFSLGLQIYSIRRCTKYGIETNIFDSLLFAKNGNKYQSCLKVLSTNSKNCHWIDVYFCKNIYFFCLCVCARAIFMCHREK